MELTIKTRKPGIPTQQARETGAPWTDTEVNYFFTSNNSIGLLESSNSFNKVKTQTAFSTKILKEDSKKKKVARWPQARWRVSCVPQGACLLMRGEWYWAISYTEVWVVASDRQVMYWAPMRKRPLHSSACQLILQWGRALRVILHRP